MTKFETRLGWISAWLAAGLLTLGGLLFVVFQAGRLDYGSLTNMRQYYQTYPWGWLIHQIINWSSALGSIFAVRAVLALADGGLASASGYAGVQCWASVDT